MSRAWFPAILAVVLSSSTCRPEARSQKAADSLCCAFLAKLHAGVPKLEHGQRIRVVGGRQGWALAYRLGKDRYWCNIRDEDGYPDYVESFRVYDRTRRTPRPNHKPAIGSTASARQALVSMWTKLGNQYPYKLTKFQFATGEGRDSGLVLGSFLREAHGHTFFNFVGVALAIDASDGVLYSYSAQLTVPPVGDPHARLTAAKAFTYVHFKAPLDKLSAWQSELGWYVPTGKTVARLGWRFWRPRDEAHAWIVDANNGRVQKPRY